VGRAQRGPRLLQPVVGQLGKCGLRLSGRHPRSSPDRQNPWVLATHRDASCQLDTKLDTTSPHRHYFIARARPRRHELGATTQAHGRGTIFLSAAPAMRHRLRPNAEARERRALRPTTTLAETRPASASRTSQPEQPVALQTWQPRGPARPQHARPPARFPKTTTFRSRQGPTARVPESSKSSSSGAMAPQSPWASPCLANVPGFSCAGRANARSASAANRIRVVRSAFHRLRLRGQWSAGHAPVGDESANRST
jgi:hypothetical protein